MSSQYQHDRHVDPNAHAPRPEPLRSPGRPWSEQGQIVMGPSFYVWDESPKQAREWGVELANAWLARRR
jgi:hypothetical protein